MSALPYLAVEVLSTDRAADTVRKFAKYAAAGLERYWIIDPDGPVVIVYHLEGASASSNIAIDPVSPLCWIWVLPG